MINGIVYVCMTCMHHKSGHHDVDSRFVTLLSPSLIWFCHCEVVLFYIVRFVIMISFRLALFLNYSEIAETL